MPTPLFAATIDQPARLWDEASPSERALARLHLKRAYTAMGKSLGRDNGSEEPTIQEKALALIALREAK